MTQTTTAIDAQNVAVWLDNINGTPVDISGSSNQVQIAWTQKFGETYTFKSKYPIRRAAGPDVTITMQVLYSTGANEAMRTLIAWAYGVSPDAARTLAVYAPTKDVGSDKFSGEFLLSEHTIPLTAGDGTPVLVSMTLVLTGQFTQTVAST